MTRLVAALLGVALAAAPARGQFVPYHGKNKVTWDRFDWKLYRSPHFDLHYYGPADAALERVVALAERGYDRLARILDHQVRFRIPLIAYRSHAEFEESNVLGLPIDESIGAFAEPGLNRLVLPIDQPDAELERLLTHELAHIFEFSLVYPGLAPQLLRRRPPDWAFEGFADWASNEDSGLKRMLLRDLVLADRIPKLSRLEFDQLPSAVLGYSLGHAAFSAIEERWGVEGIRRLWWGFRKGTLLAQVSPWKSALGIDDDEFDRTVELWLRRHFPLDERRERPWAYDRKLELGGGLDQVVAVAPAPSGELLAVLASHRDTGELDLALVSARDGRLVRNLTAGTTERWDWLALDGRLVEGRPLAWDREGARLAAFARTGKRRSLLVFDAASGALLARHGLAVDDASGPSFSPDGRTVAFAAAGGPDAGLWRIELATGKVSRLGADSRDERTPCFAPDGRSIVAVRREGEFQHLVHRSLADGGGEATLLTHGEWNDAAPWFDPEGDLYFTSDRGGAANVWRIRRDAREAEQLTDVIGGNFSPVRLAGEPARLAFVSYARGRFDVYVTALGEPRSRVALAEGEAARPARAQAWPALDPAAAGRRPRRGLHLTRLARSEAGVSSDGTFLGQTAAVFEDLLGERELTVAARSIRGYRSIYLSWRNQARRLAWGIEAFDYNNYFLADPDLGTAFDRAADDEVRVRASGAGLRARWPFSRLRRFEMGLGWYRVDRDFRRDDLDLRALGDGSSLRAELAFVEETTRFRWWGPQRGRSFRLDLAAAPGGGDLQRYATARGDLRLYLPLGGRSLVAARAGGFWSGGDDPEILAWGGAGEIRGTEYNSISGTRGFLFNLELRFPLVDRLLTPLVDLAGVRATAFLALAAATRAGRDFRFSTDDGGFRLLDPEAAFGFGVMTAALGLPLHFDWSWPTDLDSVGSSRFSVWLGFDY